MVRNILEGKKLEVLRQIQQMELSEDMFTIANAFVYELARLYMVKLLGTRADFPTAGISPYSVPQYKSCTDALSFAACEALMEEAATLDYTLKTTSIGYEQIYLLVERIEYLTRNTTA
ncbi:hypothetical protein [Chrysiogenes arsenatis]|uniref:hypothetical protein n=1 Tax=Chrysiogenes arsenatis TaxID=309797 RepID=UPI0003FE4CE6|nr:hypothetical protein [Chrysiogenes arsenatis]